MEPGLNQLRPTSMRTRKLAAGVLALAALAGCGGGQDDGGSRATGTVHGLIVMVGGPSSAPREPAAGTVTAMRGRKQMAQQKVTAAQEFSFRLTDGEYRLTVTGAGLPCTDQTVTVAADTDQAVTLVCPRK